MRVTLIRNTATLKKRKMSYNDDAEVKVTSHQNDKRTPKKINFMQDIYYYMLNCQTFKLKVLKLCSQDACLCLY